METKKVGVLVGSLRKESFSRKVAKALIELAPPSLILEEVYLGDLEIYNQDWDDEGTPPPSWTVFREKIKNYQAMLFITPEYNRSVPPLLKNALDIGSTPSKSNLWKGKPGAVISVSPGRLGGFGANHHLRQSLVVLNVPTMAQPEAYISDAGTLFDEEGRLINENTRNFLKRFLTAYEKWVEIHLP
ncbi:MAG: NAD(P)H-dependent oxidoreductase [Clostridia bacterium]|jgi:chromate reductase|nr:NAD(P)H-dependent oxidoreductase [Clostridia bacterium]